jgi:hypothetical protein
MGQAQSDPRSELETPTIWSDDAVEDTWPVNTIRPDMPQSVRCTWATASVTSWRDSTSSAAQDDLDALFNAGLDAAENLLVKRGEFFPFGVEVDGTDELPLFGADPGLAEQPPPLEVLRALVEAAPSDRERLEAVTLE